jgi:hypothetical protein
MPAFSLFKSSTSSFQQLRFYKKHLWDSIYKTSGRSVVVPFNNPMLAYAKLKQVLNDSKLRELVQGQERFEKPHDKRRRKRKEAEWKMYMAHVKSSCEKAMELKRL